MVAVEERVRWEANWEEEEEEESMEKEPEGRSRAQIEGPASVALPFPVYALCPPAHGPAPDPFPDPAPDDNPDLDVHNHVAYHHA